MSELIKKVTRNQFNDWFKGYSSLNEIYRWFQEEYIEYEGDLPTTKWERAEFLCNTIDLTDPIEVQKVLNVYAKVLKEIDTAIKKREFTKDVLNSLSDKRSKMIQFLTDDKIQYVNGKLSFINLNDGVKDSIKNIIFAVYDAKPNIVVEDWASNNIKIVEHEEKCLVYDLPITKGLTFQDLFDWYKDKYTEIGEDAQKVKEALYKRLSKGEKQGLNSFEQLFFDTYLTKFIKDKDWNKVPALIPQVWLHYDPKTIKELEGEGREKRLKHQKMDFLMLFSDRERIVIEIDGQQHYSDNNIASPKLYAEMVKYDRGMRLKGYEVYRFGVYELKETSINTKEQIEKLIEVFFNELFKKYNVDFKG